MSDGVRVRASDAERELAAEALREHYAEGRLSAQELDERLEAVYRASTREQLERLGEDLPDLPVPASVRRAELARRQAELRRHLLQHAGSSLSPFVICTVIWAAAGAEGAFWPLWLLIFPLMFLSRNAWRLYGPAPQLDRVQAELDHRRSHRGRGGHYHRHHRPPLP
jgi:hypothetical protein